MNIVDIIGIIILILFCGWGMKKGLVKSIYSLGSLILSLILALTLYPAVSDFLQESVVYDYVQINVYKVFNEEQNETVVDKETKNSLNLPGSLQETIYGTAKEAASAVKESVAESVAVLAIKILSILVVFILVKILLWVLLKLLNAVSKLPIIRTANKLLGGITGLVYGVLLIYVILAVFTFTTTLNALNKPTELILQSKYVSVMYHQNILLNFLK